MGNLEDLKIIEEQWLHQGIEFVQQIPPTQLYVANAALLLTTILLLSIRLFRRTKSNTVLLSGLSWSGKTVLFYRLRDGSSHQGVVTSMEPNEGGHMDNSIKLVSSDGAKTLEIAEANVSEAEGIYSALEKLGIDWSKVGAHLEDEGVDSFKKSFESLLGTLQEKANTLKLASN